MKNKEHFKLEVKGLQKSYTNRKKDIVVALYKCDLKVKTGEFFVILGESGCGKSTLLRVVAGLESYDFGDIYLDGIDSSSISQIDKNMSFVSQNIVLFPHKTVYENLIVTLTINRLPKEDKIKRIEELSKLFNLDMLLNRKPRELSGGQQQRVAIARSMAKKPALCLFDEPLAALDPIFHNDLIEMFKDVQKKTHTTFLYSTHNQKEAFRLADRIGIINNRKFEQIGTFEELSNKPKTEFVATYLNSIFAFVIDVTYNDGKIVYKNSSYSFKHSKDKFNKVKDTKLSMAVRHSDLIFGSGNEYYEVTQVTPNLIKVIINEKEVTLPYDNTLPFETNKINIDFKVDKPIIFKEGVLFDYE